MSPTRVDSCALPAPWQAGLTARIRYRHRCLRTAVKGRTALRLNSASSGAMNRTRLLFSPTFGTEIFENEFAFARPKGTATAQTSQFAVVLGRRFSAYDFVSRVAGRAFERGGLSHGGAYNQCPPRNTTRRTHLFLVWTLNPAPPTACSIFDVPTSPVLHLSNATHAAGYY